MIERSLKYELFYNVIVNCGRKTTALQTLPNGGETNVTTAYDYNIRNWLRFGVVSDYVALKTKLCFVKY
jgi:hypothetical protein